MASSKESYAALTGKLRTPHPAVQRSGARAILEKLAAVGMDAAGREALSHCLTSAAPAALDECVTQLCALAEAGRFPIHWALQELQAALESATALTAVAIARGIGSLCRLLVGRDGAGGEEADIQSFCATHGHPFLQAFQSSSLCQSELLQQLVLFLGFGSGNHIHSLKFLQPFITAVLLQPSSFSTHSLFSRQLHFHLASLASLGTHLGQSILRLLIQYIDHYPLQTVQEVDLVFAAVSEIVDALESAVKQATVKENVDDEYKKIIRRLLDSLIELSYKIQEHAFSMLRVLGLARRVTKLRRKYKQDAYHVFDWKVILLGHMLAVSSLEQEQLVILNLALTWLEEGMEIFNGPKVAVPCILVWIFPSLHVMTSSRNVKSAATKLLVHIEKLLEEPSMLDQTHSGAGMEMHVNSVHGNLAVAMHRLLSLLWFQENLWITWCSLTIESNDASPSTNMNMATIWLQHLQKHLEKFLKGRSDISFPHDLGYDQGFVSWICIMVTALVMHPTSSVAACEAISTVARCLPICGLSLLPVLLFHLRLFSHRDKTSSLIPLLQVLPSLASHPAVLPLVTQILQPMLDSNVNFVLQATAIRLICNTWRVTDRIFPQLKMFLEPSMFLNSTTAEMDVTLSRSISLYDVCKKDAERGIELVLSIQKCIESSINIIQAFGLQSLTTLCESDTIDFYTAWLVVSKSISKLPSDPILAKSFCEFLGNGALDAEAYDDISIVLLECLWEAAQSFKDGWSNVQDAAVKALLKYKVDTLQRSMKNDHGKHFRLLISELSPNTLQVCEELVVKFLLYENLNRKRAVKEEMTGVNKIQKFLGALPHIIFQRSEKGTFRKHFPAALLLINSHPSHIANQHSSNFGNKDYLKDLHDCDAEHERLFIEAANEMGISGNLILGLVSLQPWSLFIQRWIKEKVSILEADSTIATKEGRYTIAVEDIMKSLVMMSEQSVPRVAENAILALGALFQAAPSFSLSLFAPVNKLLEDWLSKEGHEYMQWTSAISLGVISQFLHSTDWLTKSRIIDLLLQCLSKSDRDVVKGACCMAFGFVCQNILDKYEDDNESTEDTSGETGAEKNLLRCLLFMIAKLLYQQDCFTETMFQKIQKSEMVQDLFRNMGTLHSEGNLPTVRNFEPYGANIWTVAGLAVAIGGIVTALEKAGSPDMVLAITEFLMSAVSNINSNSVLYPKIYLAIGAFLSLPTCLKACLKLELLGDAVDVLLETFQTFIQKFIVKECHDDYLGPLINTACIGSGNLLAILMEDGINLVKSERVFQLLGTFKNIWNMDYIGSGSCSMIGLANACGAAVGLFLPAEYYHKVQSENLRKLSIDSPILFDASYEEFTLSLFRELLGLTHTKVDHQQKAFAGWALALSRNAFLEISRTGFSSSKRLLGTQKTNSQLAILVSLPEKSTIRLLCSWLLNLRNAEIGRPFPYQAVASVMRSLRKAPRLPALEWGTISRLLLHQIRPTIHLVHDWDEMQKQCFLFAVSHASKVSSLTNLLDELCELSKLTLLNPSLSNFMLLHIADLNDVFSCSRMERLVDDIIEFLRRSHVILDQKDALLMGRQRHLRISLWKGFKSLLSKMKNRANEKAQIKYQCIIQSVENCMEILLDLLPQLECAAIPILCQPMQEEWLAVVDSISEASDELVLKITQIEQAGDLNHELWRLQKTILIASHMVATGKLAVSKLRKGVMICLNERISDFWYILVVLALTLTNGEIEERKQWLVDTIEYASLTSHPDTAMVFLSLLVNSSSQYSPFLCADIMPTLYDLSFNLPLLLSENVWKSSASLITCKCFSLMLKLSAMKGEICDASVSALKKICIALKQHLPVSDQIKLAEMI